MQKIVLVLALASVVALAGCASTSNTTTTTTPSAATSTPTSSTPTSTTMTSTTPSTMTPMTPTPSTPMIPEYTGPAVTDLNYTVTQTTPGPNVTYQFHGPNLTNPGWVTFHFTNQGQEPHQLVVVQLGGETFDQHMAMMMSNDTNASMMYNDTFVGGVGNVLPGDTQNATVHLMAGRYVIECEIPGPAGPHFMHGMIMEVDVSGMDNGAAEPAGSDLTLTLNDFHFNWSAAPTAGHHLVKVVNNGTTDHEAPMERLVGNHTMQDFLAWSQNPMGAPPVDMAFGAGGLAPHGVEYITVNFEAGHSYGAVCFFAGQVGAPHFTRGMITQWTT